MKRVAWLMVLFCLLMGLMGCGASAGGEAAVSDTTATDPDLSMDEQLIEAVNSDDAAAAAALLADGADPNVMESDGFFSNPIMRTAVRNGNTEIVSQLIEAGADVNAVDSKSRSILHWAVSEGETGMVRLLIDAGADVNAQDDEGFTVLPKAVNANNAEMTRMLLDAGADVHGEMSFSYALLQWSFQFPAPGVVIASAKGNNEILQMLIDAGADVNFDAPIEGDVNKWQPLSFAAQGQHLDTIDLLVANGANVDGDPVWRGGNPLGIASSLVPSAEVVEKLIAHGADVNFRGSDGEVDILGGAMASGDEEVIQLLQDAGAVSP